MKSVGLIIPACNIFAQLPLFSVVSSPRRPGPDGEGGVEAWDGMTPLHLACEGGLDNVVQTLVEHKVNVNSKVCHRLKIEKEKRFCNV